MQRKPLSYLDWDRAGDHRIDWDLADIAGDN